METKSILYNLRTKKGLSQDELAEKVFVTRQAVSRWENGETVPNTETLKQLSKLYNVSINTLLGLPHKLICQCCGMPLEDEIMGRNEDGSINEDYCKWCYADGTYTYSNLDVEEFKQKLINEINDLNIDGMPKLTKLNALVGKYVNLEYRLPSGLNVKFLDDQVTYLGNQLESEIVDGVCF